MCGLDCQACWFVNSILAGVYILVIPFSGVIGRFCLSFLVPRRKTIRGATDASASPIQHVGVDHRCFYVAVAQQLLDGADVVAPDQQVRREGMAQRVAGDPLGQSGLPFGTSKTNGSLPASVRHAEAV